jgi:hypothetical protein
MQSVLITSFHDSPLSGHYGALKTLKKVRHKFFWPKMKDDIFRYVRRCHRCQCAKPVREARVELHTAATAVCLDVKQRTELAISEIRNLRLAKNRVSNRFNVGRKKAQYKVGDQCYVREKF